MALAGTLHPCGRDDLERRCQQLQNQLQEMDVSVFNKSLQLYVNIFDYNILHYADSNSYRAF